MTPEQTERRRLYMAEYRRRPGVKARQLEQERARRQKRTPEEKARAHELKRLNTQRRRDAGIHTVTLLPRDEYERLFRAQRGLCAICRRPESSKSAKGRVRRLSIDHDHDSSRSRALLCSRCNTAIALMSDSPEIALAASEYLRWHRKVDAANRLQAALGGHRVPELSRDAAERMQEALA